MKRVVIFLLLLFFINTSYSGIWHKTEFEVDQTVILKANHILSTNSYLVVNDQANKRLLYLNKSKEWKSFPYDELYDVNNILSLGIRGNEEFYYVETKNSKYRLIKLKRNNVNFNEFDVEYMKESLFSNDTLNDYNKLTFSADPDILVSYSNEINKNNYILLHRLAYFSEIFDSVNYDNRPYFYSNSETGNSILSEAKLIVGVDFIHYFYTDKKCIRFSGAVEDWIEKNTINYTKLTVDPSGFFHIKELDEFNRPIFKNLNFRYIKEFEIGNNELAYLIAFDSLNSNNNKTFYNEQGIAYHKYESIEAAGLSQLLYKLPFEGSFISDFHINGNNVVIFYQELNTKEIYTMFSDDLGENWHLIPSYELNLNGNFEVASFNGIYYLYDENSIYQSDMATSVKNNELINIKHTITGDILNFKSESIIQEVNIYDTSGKLLLNKIGNSHDLDLNISSINQLMIISIKTNKGYKILKLSRER